MRIVGCNDYIIHVESALGEIRFWTIENGMEVLFTAGEKRTFFECDCKNRKYFIEQLLETVGGEAVMDIDISDINEAFSKFHDGFFYTLKCKKNEYDKVIYNMQALICNDVVVLCRMEGDIGLVEFTDLSEKLLSDLEEDVLLTWAYDESYDEGDVRISMWTMKA